MSSHQPRRVSIRRVATLAALMVQLASVTWAPLVHGTASRTNSPTATEQGTCAYCGKTCCAHLCAARLAAAEIVGVDASELAPQIPDLRGVTIAAGLTGAVVSYVTHLRPIRGPPLT